MIEKTKFFRNNIFVFLNRILSKFITFLLLLFVTRNLIQTEFGALTLLITSATIFWSLQDAGTSMVVVREIAGRTFDRRKIFATALLTKLGIGIVGVGIFILIFHFRIDQSINPKSVIVLFAIGALFEGSLQTVLKYFEGQEEMKYSSILVIAERIVILTVFFLSYKMYGVFFSYGISYLLSNLITFIVGMIIILKKDGLLLRIDKKMLWWLGKVSLPFFLFGAASLVYNRIDVFIIDHFLNLASLATYRACSQIIEMIYFIPINLSITLLPLFSRYYKNNLNSLKNIFPLILQQMIYLGIILCLMLASQSFFILEFLYKDKYISGFGIFSLLSVAIPFYFANAVAGNLLIAAGKEKIPIMAMIIGAVIKIVFMFILVKPLGLTGIAIGFIIAESSSFLIQIFYSQKIIHLSPYAILKDYKTLFIILLYSVSVSFVHNVYVIGVITCGIFAVFIFMSIRLIKQKLNFQEA